MHFKIKCQWTSIISFHEWYDGWDCTVYACIALSDCDASDDTVDRLYVDTTVGVNIGEIVHARMGSVFELHIGAMVDG